MKKIVFGICYVLLVLGVSARAEDKIKEIEFIDSDFTNVIRTLSELSDTNIIATPDASDRKVTIHLKNMSIESAIKSISRISGLWYKHDEDTNTFRLMTREEFSEDLVVQESQHIELFRLRNANVKIVAQAIEDLYGGRVELSLGIEAGQSSRSGSSSSSRSNSRSNNSRSNNNRSSSSSSSSNGQTSKAGSQLPDDLTVSQIEQLLQAGSLNAQTVQEVTLQAQPIYITVNNEHNMLIVRTDDKQVIQSIKTLIKKMDLPIPQVMLEMKVLSISLGDDFDSVFNFQLQPSGSNESFEPIQIGNTVANGGSTFIYEFLNSRLRANISFLEQNNRVKVLSNPMVLASNHRQTELFIGEEAILTRGFEYRAPVIDNGIVISRGFIEAQTDIRDVGITLRLTPRINSDKTVTIDLEQENSTIKEGGATIPVPTDSGAVQVAIDTVDTARLNGVVVAKDNLTVAVGGLIRNTKTKTERKVPVLSEIPIVGRVFRSKSSVDEDAEMVLLITPRILQKPEDSENLRRGNNDFYKSLNNGFPDTQPYPNKFIEDKKEPDTTPVGKAVSRQQLYYEMSKYAAEMVRVPEIERTKSDLYIPATVKRVPTTLFDDRRITATPEFSWNRGGLYVTAVRLSSHDMSNNVAVNYQNVAGKWLASSIENTALAPAGQSGNSTYLYLISALPFNEVVATN